MREEDPGWSRGEWALWWLDHDEVDEAARALEPGDSIAVAGADLRDLSAALARRGLCAVFEDGQLFVYTQEQARALAHEADLAGMAAGDRRGPGRRATETAAEAPATGARKHVS
jgi:hypothetical protein